MQSPDNSFLFAGAPPVVHIVTGKPCELPGDNASLTQITLYSLRTLLLSFLAKILLGAVLAYAIVSTEDATAKPRSNSPASTILVLGDSLSAGFGMNEGLSWVSLLQQRLHADDRDITVINASVSGETSAGGVRRLPALLEQWQPDLLLLELGGNDGLRGTNLKVIENNLATIIEQSHITGAIVVLLGMHIPPNYGPRYTAAFHQLYVTLAERYAISLVPFLLESVATKGELMQADGIHPVAKAQPIILDNVWPVLAEHLE